MLTSPPFAVMRERIAAELERARDGCERRDGIELHRSQGAVAALRVVLDLPLRILADMKRDMERNRTPE
jgi:hypothetical protein